MTLLSNDRIEMQGASRFDVTTAIENAAAQGSRSRLGASRS
jgi:hypothetical protein